MWRNDLCAGSQERQQRGKMCRHSFEPHGDVVLVFATRSQEGVFVDMELGGDRD